jgi:hypothetical protein
MQIQPPAAEVVIPITQPGRRQPLTLRLSSPQDCDELIKAVVAAKVMLTAADAANPIVVLEDDEDETDDETDDESLQPEMLRDLLSLVGVSVSLEAIFDWTADERNAAAEWAAAEHLNAADNDVARLPRPQHLSVLGEHPYPETDDTVFDRLVVDAGSGAELVGPLTAREAMEWVLDHGAEYKSPLKVVTLPYTAPDVRLPDEPAPGADGTRHARVIVIDANATLMTAVAGDPLVAETLKAGGRVTRTWDIRWQDGRPYAFNDVRYGLDGTPLDLGASETFKCCSIPMPWPTEADDRTCPECGLVYERGPVDIGAGARIKHHPDLTDDQDAEVDPAVVGTPFPGRDGYVTGQCGHAVAGSEWDAGFRTCERCPGKSDGPHELEVSEL